MFTERLSTTALLIALIGYWVVATTVFGTVLHFWIPVNLTDPQQILRTAEADPVLIVWQNGIGTVLGVCAGFAATYFSGSKGLKNALIAGVILMFYGGLGIYLHPAHALAMQIGKIVAPIPLTILGGWLRLRTRRAVIGHQ